MFAKTITCLLTAGGVALTAATPALGADAGLYGKGDPTYDGSYRQALSILALKSVDRPIPADSVRWLKRQQCTNGGLVDYRTDPTAACPAPDPANLVGPDLNATALAVAAFLQTDNRSAGRKAATWIVSKRDADRGWAYFPGPGATSDSASTALALASTKLVGLTPKSNYLAGVQKRCDAPSAQRGGLAFDTSLDSVNDGATGQAAMLLGGALTLPAPVKLSKSYPKLICTGKQADKASVLDAALGYLAKRLKSQDGALPYGGGYPGIDYAGTASAALALANAGSARSSVKLTTKYLKKNADRWIGSAGTDNPGALSLLILLARATGDDPRDFGGIDLVKRLEKSRQK